MTTHRAAMTALVDWLWTKNTVENPDKTAGTSSVSQNAPATWRTNSVVQSPPVKVAVAMRQMVMKRLYEPSRSEASTLEFIKAMPKAASHTAKTVTNATERTESLVCQIRSRSAGWASSNENVLRLASRPIVVSAMIVKPKKSRVAT